MELSVYGAGLFLPLLPLVSYVSLYLALRVLGKLSVNREGWQAGAIFFRTRLLVPALRLFTIFEPLLRFESTVVRCLMRPVKADETVSEVVVEVVRMA